MSNWQKFGEYALNKFCGKEKKNRIVNVIYKLIKKRENKTANKKSKEIYHKINCWLIREKERASCNVSRQSKKIRYSYNLWHYNRRSSKTENKKPIPIRNREWMCRIINQISSESNPDATIRWLVKLEQMLHLPQNIHTHIKISLMRKIKSHII